MVTTAVGGSRPSESKNLDQLIEGTWPRINGLGLPGIYQGQNWPASTLKVLANRLI